MAERTEKHGFAKQAYDKVCYAIIYLFYHHQKNNSLTIEIKFV
jgi:hypothetical protein